MVAASFRAGTMAVTVGHGRTLAPSPLTSSSWQAGKRQKPPRATARYTQITKHSNPTAASRKTGTLDAMCREDKRPPQQKKNILGVRRLARFPELRVPPLAILPVVR